MGPVSSLLEVDAFFQDCVKQRKMQGSSGSAAAQACSYPSGFGFVGAPVEPSEPEPEEPVPVPAPAPAGLAPMEDYGTSRADDDTTRTDDGDTSGYPQAPAYGTLTDRVRKKPRKGASKRSEDASWGGRDLTPGFVPGNRDPRAEAELWAKEVAADGQRPVTDQGAWETHAARMGFTPDQIDDGWRYIQAVFNKRYVHVVAELQQIFEFSGQPYGGYYSSIPHEFKINMPQAGPLEPSWPWRTKEAERVYKAAVAIIAKNPDLDMMKVYELALMASQITPYEMSPEDDAIMGIALQWVMSGKIPRPEPPDVATSRSAYGMKGTQIGYGRSLTPRGAP